MLKESLKDASLLQRFRKLYWARNSDEEKLEPLPEEPKASSSASTSKTHAPNITLNYDKRVPKWQLWIVAAIGMILQVGVLVFETTIVYVWEELKEDSPLQGSAYPFAVIGTGILVVGMMLCSRAIEESSRETTWRSKAGKFHIMWVQRGEAVNDQMFQSYALFAKGERDTLMTSHPASDVHNLSLHSCGNGHGNNNGGVAGLQRTRKDILNFFKNPGSDISNDTNDGKGLRQTRRDTFNFLKNQGNSTSKEANGGTGTLRSRTGTFNFGRQGTQLRLGESLDLLDSSKNKKSGTDLAKMDKYLAEDEALSRSTEALVMFATGCSLTGFVLQFIGLRGLHWWVTVAQMGATLVMTVLRAWIRRDLAGKPFSQPLPLGHELDWLATRLTDDDFWGRVQKEREARKTRKKRHRRAHEDPHQLHQHLQAAKADQLFSDEDKHAVFWGRSCSPWNIVTNDIDMKDKKLITRETLEEVKMNLRKGDGQIVYDDRPFTRDEAAIRRRLKELTQWDCIVTPATAAVSKSMEAVLDRLYTSGQVARVQWPLEACYGRERRELRFNLMREKGRWRAREDEVEAVLSLWLYALNVTENDPTEKKVQLLGPSSLTLLRDLSWWVEDDSTVIVEAEPSDDLLTDEYWDVLEVDDELPAPNDLRVRDFFGFGMLALSKLNEMKLNKTQQVPCRHPDI